MESLNVKHKVIVSTVCLLGLATSSAYVLYIGYIAWKGNEEEKQRLCEGRIELEKKVHEKEETIIQLERKKEDIERNRHEESVALNKIVKEKKELISQLKNELDALGQENQQQGQDLELLERERQRLREDIESLQNEINELQNQNTKNIQLLKEKEKQNREMNDKLMGTEEKYKRCEKLISQLEKLQQDKQMFHGVAKRPKPLTNLGNTCFMDAMLQNLAWCPKLGLELQKHLYEQKLSAVSGMEMTNSLYKLLRYTHNQNSSEIRGLSWSVPGDILTAARKRNKDFQGYNQQDSFEMFNTIIEGLREESEGNDEKNTVSDETYEEKMMRKCRPARLIFGMFVTVYLYDSCEHVESVYQEFSSLTVPVMKNPKYHGNHPAKGSGKKNKKQKSKKPKNTCSNHFNGKLSFDEEDEKHENESTKWNNGDTEQSDEEDIFHDALEVQPTVDLENGPLPNDKKVFGRERAFETLSLKDDFSTDLEYGLSNGLMAIEEFSEEIMSCRKCKSPAKTGTCYKKTLLCDLPFVLVVHLDRFKENHRGSLEKRNDNVSYPDVLDIAPFCSTTVKILPQGHQQVTSYKLFGVVAHSGSINSGHYVAFVKTSNRSSAEWYVDMVGKPWVSPAKCKEDVEALLEGKTIEKETDHIPITPAKWFYISDETIKECENDREATQNRNAYVLMYEKA